MLLLFCKTQTEKLCNKLNIYNVRDKKHVNNSDTVSSHFSCILCKLCVKCFRANWKADNAKCDRKKSQQLFGWIYSKTAWYVIYCSHLMLWCINLVVIVNETDFWVTHCQFYYVVNAFILLLLGIFQLLSSLPTDFAICLCFWLAWIVTAYSFVQRLVLMRKSAKNDNSYAARFSATHCVS